MKRGTSYGMRGMKIKWSRRLSVGGQMKEQRNRSVTAAEPELNIVEAARQDKLGDARPREHPAGQHYLVCLY